MATPKVRNDLIPMKSGIVRITPLDANFIPQFDDSYTTKREFLTSTQVTTSRTTETLPNGNGSDKDFITDQRHSLALVTQTYDQKFHAALSGDLTVSTVRPILHDTTIVVGTDGSFTFSTNETPIASLEDSEIHFEIRNTFGVRLTETTDAVTADTFKYDADTKTLTFATSLAGASLSCVYYVAGTDGEGYETSPILKSRAFMLEIFGEMRSADSEEPIQYYARMPRATVSGDLPRVTTQKSISAAITYNFVSAPVPQGISDLYESFTPMAS